MGSQLAIQSRAIQWQEPHLPEALRVALGWMKLQPGLPPIVDPETRVLLPALADHFDERLTPAKPERIEAIVAYLAMAYPAGKLSDDEAQARLSIYVEGLSDLPEEVLQEASRAAVRQHKFFPTVAELRKLASVPHGKLCWPGCAIRTLMRKHDEEWRDPADFLPPEEAAAKLREIAATLGESMKV